MIDGKLAFHIVVNGKIKGFPVWAYTEEDAYNFVRYVLKKNNFTLTTKLY